MLRASNEGHRGDSLEVWTTLGHPAVGADVHRLGDLRRDAVVRLGPRTMRFRKILVWAFVLLGVALAGNSVVNRSFGNDEQFRQAEELLREDADFRKSFGDGAKIYRVRKTVANRLPPHRSYVELGFRVEPETGAGGSRAVRVRLYERRDGLEGAYELEMD